MKNTFTSTVFLLFISLILSNCKKDDFSISTETNDSFHVKNGDYLIPVLVRGNTASNKIILYIQGGPGYASLDFAKIDYPGWKSTLEKDYAVAYYDQRGTGNRQGDFTQDENTLATWLDDLHQVASFLEKAYKSEVIMLGHSFGGDLMYRYMLQKGDSGIPTKYISTNSPVTTDSDQDTLRWDFRRTFLFNTANLEIARGTRVSEWNDVLDWLSVTPEIKMVEGDDPYQLFNQWNQYVEDLINVDYPERAVSIGEYMKVIFASVYNPFPYLNATYKDELVTGILHEEEADFIIDKMHLIDHQKVLILTGRYDDICPPEELTYAYEQITSPFKQMEIFDYSGHTPFTDKPQEFFDAIKLFID